MTPAQIERVFGRGRLKMATGEHVEVFREAVAPGERRRYTKRFLATSDGDFGQWTEREWRILARLIGHGIRCVPDVVQFDGGAMGGVRLVQTYDAGVTVDQWATLLPVSRDGNVRVFGRGRLKMTTGEHVEVFREAVAPGERRRYTKRFLATSDGDFGQWTEREWRILARLIGHGIRCVPDVVQFDGGAMGGVRLVQTYDAGVTVDQWATLLPVSRDGTCAATSSRIARTGGLLPITAWPRSTRFTRCNSSTSTSKATTFAFLMGRRPSIRTRPAGCIRSSRGSH